MEHLPKVAGAGPLSDYSVGQRVLTREGYPGVVTDILEGPADLTTIWVALDNGLGGGEYAEAELQPLQQTSAQMASIPVEALENTAASDYPELSSILSDRPPPTITTHSAKNDGLTAVISNNPEYSQVAMVERRRWEISLSNGRTKYVDSRKAAVEWCEEMGISYEVQDGKTAADDYQGQKIKGHCKICGKAIVLKRGALVHADGSNDHAVEPSDGGPLGVSSSKEVAERLALYLPPAPPGEQRGSVSPITPEQKPGYDEGFAHGREGITRNPSRPDDENFRIGYDLGWSEGVTSLREPANSWDYDDLAKDQTAELDLQPLPISYAARQQVDPDTLTSQDLQQIEQIVHEVRTGEGAGGQCYLVAEILSKRYGWDLYGGIYHSADGHPLGDHGWNVYAPTGAIIDATPDQWGEGGGVRVVKPGSPDFSRYRYAESEEQESDWLDQARKERDQRGDFWWAGGLDAPEVQKYVEREKSYDGGAASQFYRHAARDGGWKRHEYGYISHDREFYLERGARMSTGGTNAWLIHRKTPEDKVGRDSPTPYHKDTGNSLFEVDGDLYDHIGDEGNLADAKHAVETYYRKREAARDSVVIEAGGLWDWIKGTPKQDKDWTSYADRTSYDWCRFRRHSHCWLPKQLNEAASKQAGYAVWVPFDRGICYRAAWDLQKKCPTGEPGPHAGVGGMTDATVPWDEGGQRGGVPSSGPMVPSDYYANETPPLTPPFASLQTQADSGWVDGPAEPEYQEDFPGSWIYGGREAAIWYSVGNIVDPRGCTIHAVQVEPWAQHQGKATRLLDWMAAKFAGHAVDPGGLTPEGKPLWNGWVAKHDWPRLNIPGPHNDIIILKPRSELTEQQQAHVSGLQVDAEDHPDEKHTECQNCERPISWYAPRARDYWVHDHNDSPWCISAAAEKKAEPKTSALQVDAGLQSEAAFEVLASWADIREKAKRIRSEGGVRIVAAQDNVIVGHVRGDHGVYETEVMRHPGKQNVAAWHCGCKWAAYSWGRSGPWKRYEGRQCSHALALHLEAQARGMFGRTLTLDEKQPAWMDNQTVHQYGDYDRDKQRYSALEKVARKVVFKGRVWGLIRDLFINDDGHVYDAHSDQHIDHNQVLYPGWHPSLGLNIHDTGKVAAAKKDDGPVWHFWARSVRGNEILHFYYPASMDRKDALNKAKMAYAQQTGRLVPTGSPMKWERLDRKPTHESHLVFTGGSWSAPYDSGRRHFLIRDPQGNPPSHQYRWMNLGEYRQAQQRGHFEFGINASAEPDSTYGAADSILVRFPHSDDVWEGKDDAVLMGKPYSRALTQIPFLQGEIAEGKTAKKDDGPSVSGVALKAADTGRVLMLQRQKVDNDKDPAAGTWEFPGGHHDDGDLTSLHAAIREWEEEVGQPFPEGGTVAHTWTSPDGVYQGHLVVIPEEAAVNPSQGRSIDNPDDPGGDYYEAVAWWDPDHARKNPAIRPECKATTPWAVLKRDLAKAAAFLTEDEVRSGGIDIETLACVDPVTGQSIPFRDWLAQATAKTAAVINHPWDGEYEEGALGSPRHKTGLGYVIQNSDPDDPALYVWALLSGTRQTQIAIGYAATVDQARSDAEAAAARGGRLAVSNRFPCSVCGKPGGYIITTRGGTRQWDIAGSPTRGRKHYCKEHVLEQIDRLNLRDQKKQGGKPKDVSVPPSEHGDPRLQDAGVSVKRTPSGKYYVTTHRARGKYRDSVADIPDSEIEFIRSTGAYMAEEQQGLHAAAALTKTADEDQCPACAGDSLPSGGGGYSCQDCGHQWHPDDIAAQAFHGDGPLRGVPLGQFVEIPDLMLHGAAALYPPDPEWGDLGDESR